MILRLKNKVTEIYFLAAIYVSLFFPLFSSAAPIGPGGSINADTQGLKDAVTQWGTTFSGTCVFITGTLAVCSLIIPWDFFKQTIGRKAWVGLITAVVVYLVLSYFGNSIHQALAAIFQCPLSIINVQCTG